MKIFCQKLKVWNYLPKSHKLGRFYSSNLIMEDIAAVERKEVNFFIFQQKQKKD